MAENEAIYIALHFDWICTEKKEKPTGRTNLTYNLIEIETGLNYREQEEQIPNDR